VDGYTSIICTLSGERTVFVAFDDNGGKKHDTSDCLKCPACIVLNHASAWVPAISLAVNASVYRQSYIGTELRLIEVTGTTFPRYLSQGPPVRV